MYWLTVAIPTYNRPDDLRACVAAVLDQLPDDVQLLVLDNCGPVPAAETLADMLHVHSRPNVKIIRNKANVGGDANILRCVEEADGEWLWVIGDDDVAAPDGIATVRRLTQRYSDAVCINTVDIEVTRAEERRFVGLSDFIRGIDDYGNLLFVSSDIFRVEPISPYLGYGYRCCHAYCPMMALTLMALGSDGVAVLSSERILSGHGYPAEGFWTSASLAMNAGTVADLPIPAADAAALRPKIASMEAVSLELVILNLIAQRKKQSYAEVVRVFDCAYANTMRYDQRLLARLAARVYRLALVNAKFCEGLHQILGFLWMRPNYRKQLAYSLVERAVLFVSPITPPFLKRFYRRVRPNLYAED